MAAGEPSAVPHPRRPDRRPRAGAERDAVRLGARGAGGAPAGRTARCRVGPAHDLPRRRRDGTPYAALGAAVPCQRRRPNSRRRSIGSSAASGRRTRRSPRHRSGPPAATAASAPRRGRRRSAASPRASASRPARPAAMIVFTTEDAARLKARGRHCILVVTETGPADIEGMKAATGILTARGGMTSHAGVIARITGKPCVAGVRSLQIDLRGADLPHRRARVPGRRPHHHRRHRRRRLSRRPAAGPAPYRRRHRQAARLVRRQPHHRGPHQCRNASIRRAPPSASAPRASAWPVPSTCSSRPSAWWRCAA